MPRDHDIASAAGHSERLAVAGAAGVVTVAVFLIGVRRRRSLGARPHTARREVLCTGAAILTMTALVVAYLIMPLF